MECVDYNIKKIECICPVYIEKRGDCTLIFDTNCVVIVNKPIYVVLDSLFKKAAIKVDDNFIKRVLNSSNGLPIVCNDSIFIKIKFRKPRVKKDAAYGYINLKCIENVNKKYNDIFIKISSGYTLKVESSFSFIHKSINTARFINLILKHMSKTIDVKENKFIVNEYRKKIISKELIGEFIK